MVREAGEDGDVVAARAPIPCEEAQARLGCADLRMEEVADDEDPHQPALRVRCSPSSLTRGNVRYSATTAARRTSVTTRIVIEDRDPRPSAEQARTNAPTSDVVRTCDHPFLMRRWYACSRWGWCHTSPAATRRINVVPVS